MTLKANWKQWSIPVCLTVSLAAGHVQGQQLAPAGEVPPAALQPAGLTDTTDETDLAPIPEEEAALPEALQPEVAAPAAEVPQAAETKVPAPATLAEDTSEVIEERYPNGTLKIAREVIQDAQGNYLNHGSWKMFNERGALLVEGQYYEDQRHGVWNRWYQAGEVAFLRQKPYTDFSAPFISQGIFDSGDLHGAWIISDAKHRKVCEIRFSHGEREGVATWYHANGRKMREMKFDKGVVHGDVVEWHPDGAVASKDVYDQGRRQIMQTVHYGGDAKKFSGQFLEPPLVAKKLDDWWKGEMASYASTGKPIKHGPYTAWHPNGAVRMKGEYKYDIPVGVFTWSYANGQKSLEGMYEDGKQQGEWSWWHDNGQRSIRGEFAAGNPAGKWIWWNTEGKVAQSGDFSDDKGQIVVAPVQPVAPETQTPRQAATPTPAKTLRR